MDTKIVIAGSIILMGIVIDLLFIRSEYAKKMKEATVLKGLASLMFVILGIFLYKSSPASVTRLILLGLVFGMLGDIFLNLRNLYEGGVSNKIFAVGILLFLIGHFMYIAALICCDSKLLLPGIGIALVLSVLSIPPLMKRISAPSKGLKIFGYVYLVIVISMFSASVALLLRSALPAGTGISCFQILFTVGAGLFVVSDFIMIYYSFGKKIAPLRAINLLSYYIGQILIALCISVFA